MIKGRSRNRAALCLYIIPMSLFLVLSGLTHFFFNGISIKPILFGWGLASINYGAALWIFTVAQRSQLLLSMWLVFGGGGLRMLVMVCGVIIVLVKKPEWLYPFAMALLACFVAYLLIEVGVIHRRGLLKQ